MEYHNLPRGSYTFEVLAVDRDLVYSERPATVALRIRLPYSLIGWVSTLSVAVLLIAWQAGRIVQRDRTLSAANEDLRREMDERQRAELERARLVSLGQMVAGVAHELNQPLTVISGAAEDIYLRLAEGIGISEEQLKEKMRDVLDLSERMTGTIEHLRMFSRDTSREPGIPVSINDVIHTSLKLIEAQLRNHDIALHLDLTEGLPPVTGHPYQMEQVFLNLLSNARDALDERENSTAIYRRDEDWEKRITIRTRQEGDEVVAEVEDNGAGMDEAIRTRLFEPFFTTKEADRGTGLGLSISYAIVRDHGGRITCESRKGEGTTFRVRLPVSET